MNLTLFTQVVLQVGRRTSMSFEPAVLHSVTAYHTPPGPANKPEVWARARLVRGTPFGAIPKGWATLGAAPNLETNGKPKTADSTAAAINEHAQNAGNQN